MRFFACSFVITLVMLSFSPTLMAAPRYARVVVGTREVPLSPRAVVENGVVYAPADILRTLGADYAAGDHKVTIASDDKAIELSLSEKNKSRMIRLDEAVKALNAQLTWDDATSTARVLAKLTAVEFSDSKLTIRTSLPVAVTYDRLWAPANGAGWRISVDLAGTVLATDSKSYPVQDSVVKQIRLGQFNEDTARVVLDISNKTGYQVLTKEPSREIKVAIGTSEPKESQKTGNTTPVTPVNITNVKVDPDGDSRIRVRIWTSGKATFSTSMLSNPSRVVVDIQKGNIAMSKEDMELDHPILKRVRFGQQDSASRIVFDVSRYVLVAGDADPNGINLSLQLPKGAGGKLADKTIVIDPGHGGRDPGAQRNGVQEKTLNLQISNAIRYALEREGAKVILTRYDDQFLELSDRPAVADQYRADFFISVHCNAMPSPNTATGIQTLYSNKSGSNYLLAAALHNQIVRLTGMSDGKVRNRPGLIVLKHANIPAVLLECGFIDNDRDRQKLCDPTYHRTLAQAVVDGLKHYVEGTTESEGN